MANKIYIVLLSGMISFTGFDLTAQDDNRGRRNRNDDAINTRQETPVKIIEFIIGTWDVAAVYKNDKNITGTDTLVAYTTLRFNRENQYAAFEGSQQVDSGTFRLNENHSILYLESAGGGEPQWWDVSFDDALMILQPGQSATAFDQAFRYIYRRRQ